QAWWPASTVTPGSSSMISSSGTRRRTSFFNAGRTVAGTNVEVAPIPTANLTFTTIASPGQTVITPLNSDQAILPADFQVAAPSGGFASYFDVATTATFSGHVTLGFAYDPAQFDYDPATNPGGL